MPPGISWRQCHAQHAHREIRPLIVLGQNRRETSWRERLGQPQYARCGILCAMTRALERGLPLQAVD